jgi:hypothetical protein
MQLKHYVIAGGLLFADLGCHIAHAALGEPQASVRADVAQLRGEVEISRNPLYDMHVIHLPSGTQVREYAATDGKVFAVAWNGPTVPNLRQTLGQYFDRYVAAAKANRLGRHPLRIDASDLVVHTGGHMRAFSGLAYLPQALPEGVTPGDLK